MGENLAPPNANQVNGKRRRAVLCVQKNWIYATAAEAARQIGLSYTTIHNACNLNDTGYTVRGLAFVFVDLPPGPLLPTMTEPTPFRLRPYRQQQGSKQGSPNPHKPVIDMTKPGWRSRLIRAGIERPGHRMRRRPAHKPAANENPGR
jgi:hypothetical protein